MANLKIMDIAKYQGTVDWDKASKAVDGVIIRAGYRGYGSSGTLVTDSQFFNNIRGATEKNMRVGVYFFSQAITAAEAEEEAKYTINLMKGFKSKINMPVYFDSEWSHTTHDGRADKLSKADRTTIAIKFMDTIKAAGYIPGIYAGVYWLRDNMEDSRLKGYTHWIPQYASKCTYTGDYDAWQYTSKATVDGISGGVDMSYFYKDFSTTKATTTTTTTKTTTTTTEKTTTTTDNNVTYTVYANNKWATAVTDGTTIGTTGKPISGVAIKTDKGTIKYRVHLAKGNGWLSWINNYNIKDWNKGCAGIKSIPINGIQMSLAGVVGYQLKYRVKMVGDTDFLPWVVGTNDYAGLASKPNKYVELVEIKIVKV